MRALQIDDGGFDVAQFINNELICMAQTHLTGGQAAMPFENLQALLYRVKLCSYGCLVLCLLSQACSEHMLPSLK